MGKRSCSDCWYSETCPTHSPCSTCLYDRSRPNWTQSQRFSETRKNRLRDAGFTEEQVRALILEFG